MSFTTDLYEISRKVVPEHLLTAAQEYYKILAHQGGFDSKKLKSISKVANDRYCDAFAILIQEFLQPVMEERTGLELLATYNYARVYSPDTALLPHTDRHSCEISATLTISNVPDEVWPFYLRNTDGKTIAVELDPGDMLIYRGIDLPHWREPGKVEQTGIFMHWVDANGPYINEAGDPSQQQSPRNLGVLHEKRRKKSADLATPTITFN